MALRLLRNPALLTSIAVHAAVVGVGTWVGRVVEPVDRPALLLGIESPELVGSVDVEAPPPPPDMAPVVEAVADFVPDAPTPEEALELPPDEAVIADAEPLHFHEVPVGVRNAPKVRLLAAPTPPVVASAPPSPSRRGSRTQTRSAERIGNAPPIYPMEALRHHWEGTAVLDVRVTSEGLVSEATVYESSGSRVLDDASIAAALTYRYSPRLVDDVPAPDWLRVPFVWKITGP